MLRTKKLLGLTAGDVQPALGARSARQLEGGPRRTARFYVADAIAILATFQLQSPEIAEARRLSAEFCQRFGAYLRLFPDGLDQIYGDDNGDVALSEVSLR